MKSKLLDIIVGSLIGMLIGLSISLSFINFIESYNSPTEQVKDDVMGRDALISIYDLQTLLAEEGYDIEPDGLIGPLTIEAYKDWDRKYGVQRIGVE